VLEQYVYDRKGTLLASAVAKSHTYYEKLGISLPQEIDVQIPSAGLSLSIDVGTVALNGPLDNAQVWTMPAIPGSPAVDLGAAPPNSPGGGAPNLGDQLTRADWYTATTPSPAPNVLDGTPTMAPLSVPAPAGVAFGAPQFVPSGGRPADPGAGVAAPAANAPGDVQRLPVGGVAAQPAFAR
jgi:hypothetical protein